MGWDDFLVVFELEVDVVQFVFDLWLFKEVCCCGVIVMVFGSIIDFVFCCFYLVVGVDEDLVIGFVYMMMILYWVECFLKQEFIVCQLSKRGGYLCCIMLGEWVAIFGLVVIYMEGEIFIQKIVDVMYLSEIFMYFGEDCYNYFNVVFLLVMQISNFVFNILDDFWQVIVQEVQ